MKILIIGDIVGKPGRKIIGALLPGLLDDGIDFVVANGENAAGGMGITPDVADELMHLGIDVVTSGNHIWRKKEILPYLDDQPRLLRPANYPLGTPGGGAQVYRAMNGTTVGVMNLEGRVFMRPLESPFAVAEEILARLRRETPIIIVDFHAEATSEKRALGFFLDGKVSAVIGTHTHVQTADEHILPGGTAYITDAGMTGPVNSVIGVKKEIAIERFVTMLPNKFETAGGEAELQGVIIEVDEQTGMTVEVHRIRQRMGQGTVL